MKKKVFFAAMLLVLFTSCATNVYYQVYEVKSPDVSRENNVLSYENDDCSVKYNLWAEGGNLSFLFQNKTDKNIYIVMPQSFFILNGVANDYYSESTYSNSVTGISLLSSSRTASISGFLTNSLSWYPAQISRQDGVSAGTSVSKGVQTKEPQFVCIPPKSAKFIKGFNIYDHAYKDCDNYKENYPKKVSTLIQYTQANSPVTFRNRIAYSFSNDAAEVEFIDHTFWLSSLQNYSSAAAFSKQKVEKCETTIKSTEKVFTMSSPDKFYNSYLPTWGSVDKSKTKKGK